MNCQRAKKRLPLYAGGELAPRQTRALLSHLKKCRECSLELQEYRDYLEFIRRTADRDKPGALPKNLTHIIQQRMIESGKEMQALWKRKAWGFGIFACGLAAALVMMLVLPSRKGMTVESLLKKIQEFPELKGSMLEWDSKNPVLKAFTGPQKAASWDIPQEAGVCLILHKTDPEKKPNSYKIDYCAEGKDLSAYTKYSWYHQRIKRLLSLTGSLENTYVIVLLMPNSSRQERYRLEKALIRKFRPIFNKGA